MFSATAGTLPALEERRNLPRAKRFTRATRRGNWRADRATSGASHDAGLPPTWGGSAGDPRPQTILRSGWFLRNATPRTDGVQYAMRSKAALTSLTLAWLCLSSLA